jgi:hypothetical protein
MTSGSSGTNPTETHAGDDVADDVAERLRFEALVSDLAAGFINLEPEQVDQAIEDCLRRIVQALGLDRSTLLQGDDLVSTHAWAAPGFNTVVGWDGPTCRGRSSKSRPGRASSSRAWTTCPRKRRSTRR